MSARPDVAMMAAVERLARFMITREEADLFDIFADGGVVIVENFAPYVFHGPSAVRDWADGFRSHADDLSQLRPSFGAPQDFSSDGERVYFSLPTTWAGLSCGRRFSEDGGWSFVLVRDGAAWRVQSYGWAVTDYRAS
jgi:hypothetical protein